MPEVDVLKISNEDAAFVLGKNGKTKEKIARVSGADLDLYEHSLTLEIRGTDDERKRAKKYARRLGARVHRVSDTAWLMRVGGRPSAPARGAPTVALSACAGTSSA
jgi:hypothetical protein